ncbi:MAG: serine hydrolase domain-containing protein [Pseudomonadota bacterium]
MNIESILDRAIDSGAIAGLTAFVGNRAGMITSHAAGLADPASGVPMKADTIFQIASMTKAITSVAAMQLVEQGRLSLDAPIETALPELANPQVITGFDDAGNAALRPATRPITLRHLLTHTSGFGYSFMNADMLRAYGPAGPPPPGSIASVTSELLFDPGAQWEYGVSTDWVGFAVVAASGQSLGRYMAEHIFNPLGMNDTGFTLSDAQMARRAAMLSRGGDGVLSPFPVEMGGGPDAEFEGGGGGLMSSGPDYLRFVRMILNGGSLDGVTILKPETIAEMRRNQIGPLRAGKMDTIMPMFSHPYDGFPDMHTGWGLGFLINPETGPNGRAPGSLAWAGIANSFYWIDPVSDVTGVLMMQFLPFGDPHALALYAAFERAVYEGLQ